MASAADEPAQPSRPAPAAAGVDATALCGRLQTLEDEGAAAPSVSPSDGSTGGLLSSSGTPAGESTPPSAAGDSTTSDRVEPGPAQGTAALLPQPCDSALNPAPGPAGAQNSGGSTEAASSLQWPVGDTGLGLRTQTVVLQADSAAEDATLSAGGQPLKPEPQSSQAPSHVSSAPSPRISFDRHALCPKPSWHAQSRMEALKLCLYWLAQALNPVGTPLAMSKP